MIYMEGLPNRDILSPPPAVGVGGGVGVLILYYIYICRNKNFMMENDINGRIIFIIWGIRGQGGAGNRYFIISNYNI